MGVRVAANKKEKKKFESQHCLEWVKRQKGERVGGLELRRGGDVSSVVESASIRGTRGGDCAV